MQSLQYSRLAVEWLSSASSQISIFPLTNHSPYMLSRYTLISDMYMTLVSKNALLVDSTELEGGVVEDLVSRTC